IWQYWPAPALSGPLATQSGATRIRLPPASPPCCDRTEAKVSHLHSNRQRLTAQGDISSPGASLHREGDVVTAGEPGQPDAQVRPVGWSDLAAPHLPGDGVQVVEGQLLPVDIQPAYDRHRDLRPRARAPSAPREWLANQA